MALSAFISVLRVLIILLSAAVFGINQYFLNLWRNNDHLVFHWRLYAQIAIAGIVFLVMLASEIHFRFKNNRRRAHEDFQSQYGKVEELVPKKRSGCQHFWIIARFVWVWIFAAGILAYVVPNVIDRQRIFFEIPVSRDSPEAQAYKTGRKSPEWRPPKDLFSCQSWVWDQPMTYLCKLDEQCMMVALAVSFLCVIEGLATLFNDYLTRDYVHFSHYKAAAPGYPTDFSSNAHTYTAGHVIPLEPIKNEEEEPKQKSIFRTLKQHIRRDEVYDQEQQGYNPHSTYSAEARHVSSPYAFTSDRSLPPLPARPDEDEEEVRSDSAMLQKPAVPVPVPTGHGPNPFLNEDQQRQQQLAYAQAGGSSQTPFHYPADVKRSDGF
ncbi:hypothetical protein BGX33_003502 [Mortierella sp. NVP41]|nr:hypothetical protein BGX33_003502 [Mortierella sp. NVP41]